jgi:hypothetical protein
VNERECETCKQLPPAENEDLQRALEELPATRQVLDLLFKWLEERLVDTECDNTLRLTTEFAGSNGLDEKRLCHWVEQYHGYCDCEVLWNVRDTNLVFRS